MRKKTFSFVCDELFWYLLYFLPVIIYGILCAVNIGNGTILSFSEVFTQIGLNINTDGVVYTTLSSILGADGILPLFQNSDLIMFFTYFCNVMIAHLLVDFVLFIPRLAHTWMNKFCGGEK